MLLNQPGKNTTDNTTLCNFTTTTQLIITTLILGKVSTTFSVAFTPAPPLTTTIVIPKPTTITSLQSATTTKKPGIPIVPGITLPNPFDLLKPADPTKTTTIAAAPAEPPKTTTTIAKETTKATTTSATSTPTKKPGLTPLPGITLPVNPFNPFPGDHPDDKQASPEPDPTKSNGINNRDDEEEEEEDGDADADKDEKYDEDNDDDDDDDEGDNEKEIKEANQDSQQDTKAEAEEESGEHWNDEEEEDKKQTKKDNNNQQKVLKQRPLERIRRHHHHQHHHHHRQSARKDRIVRRQELSFHDVIQIARSVSVTPPVKTMRLFTQSTTPPLSTDSTDHKHAASRDDKDIVSNKDDKLSPPTDVTPVSKPTSSEAKDPSPIRTFSSKVSPSPNLGSPTLTTTTTTPSTLTLTATLTSSSSPQHLLFQGPRALSRVSILTSILNTFLPPFVLQFRADLRNFLYWICSPSASAHIDGKDASGEDDWAKKIAKDDAKKLIHPDGSIDLASVWDSRIRSVALECIKNHAQAFINEIVNLAGTRFTQVKEGVIGLPKFLFGASLPVDQVIPHLALASVSSEQQEAKGQEGNAAQKNVANPSVVEQQQQPVQQGQPEEPSTASGGAQGLKTNQRTELIDKTDEFLTWFVDSVVNELQEGYFADSKAAGASKVESTESSDSGSSEFGDSICSWMKERIEKIVQ
ncbi:hypothetical protein BGX29_000979 [Mortierella sp. GBA35]|nr:hypothetical protein BGX29_000979 [Mortierella sp. GBA35]